MRLVDILFFVVVILFIVEVLSIQDTSTPCDKYIEQLKFENCTISSVCFFLSDGKEMIRMVNCKEVKGK